MSEIHPNGNFASGDRSSQNYAAYSLTPDGRVSSWTASARHIKGYESGEIVGRHFSVFYRPEDVASGMPDALLREAAATGYAMAQGWRLRKNGTRFWAAVVISAVRDAEGRLTGFSKFTHDLSSVHETETALRLSEEKFYRAFTDAASGMALVSLQGQWLDVNRALCAYLGYSSAELSRLRFQDLTYSEDLSSDLALLERTLAGEISHYQLDKRYVRKDGSVVWGHLNVSLIRDNGGAPLYFLSQVIDITETKLATERVRQLADMLDQANDAIISSDLAGRINYWNSGAQRIFGWTGAEVLGKRTEDFIPTESMAGIMVAREGTLANGEWSGELQIQRKDGPVVIVESHQILFNDSTGRPAGHLTIALDITAKKQVEAQLLRAQRLESVGTLAGGIAHDLNNVLAPILMSIELLRRRTNDRPELHTLLDRLQLSARRGATLVRQILTFARGSSTERAPVQLRHLAREVEALLTDTLPKKINLELVYPADLWPVLGDSTQLQQVLLNFCVNARDAMPSGGTITLLMENAELRQAETTLYSEAAPGDYVRIVVTDTGIGMSREVQERIFEPFFTTKKPGEGTGLGLSTVLAIVKGHGGLLRVDSTPGQGSRFEVLLPASARSAGDSDAGAAVAPPPRGHGELVLLADDETSIREIGRETLEQFGYRVLTAASGADAVALYAQYRTDIAVVIVDMSMPIMDGPATIRALRSLNPEVCIICSSGHLASAEEAARMGGVKPRDFLAKPYPAEQLLVTVAKVIAQDSSAPFPAGRPHS